MKQFVDLEGLKLFLELFKEALAKKQNNNGECYGNSKQKVS